MLGAQYQITDIMYSRAGIRYVTSAVPIENVSVANPDANRFSYAAGLGFVLIEKLTIDVSVAMENVNVSFNNSYYGTSGCKLPLI
jgi:long-subunit fatty acid transport protein